LKKKVEITNIVENYLNNLTDSMIDTLKGLLDELLRSNFDINKYPSQILNLCEGIQFDINLQKSIRSNTLVSFKDELINKLST